jgi:hypothetical protein
MFTMGGSCSIPRSHDEDDSTVRRRALAVRSLVGRGARAPQELLTHVCALYIADHGANGQRRLSQLAPAFCGVWGTY